MQLLVKTSNPWKLFFINWDMVVQKKTLKDTRQNKHGQKQMCNFLSRFAFSSFISRTSSKAELTNLPLHRSTRAEYNLITTTLNLSGEISLCLRIIEETHKMKNQKCKSGRVGSFFPFSFRGDNSAIEDFQSHRNNMQISTPWGAEWLTYYQQRGSRRIWVSVWSNQKTEARLKRCTAKYARQQEHFKQNANPAGDRMLGPPAETGSAWQPT